MTEPSQHPLTDKALARLRQLAKGNGLDPDSLQLVETQEKIYTLEGTIILTPSLETANSRYPGPIAGKDRQILDSMEELQAELQRRQEEFKNSTSWIPAVIAELKSAPAHGWGYDDATVTLSDKTAVLAASMTCPQCRGQRLLPCSACQATGQIVCPQCHGRRQEICITCNGRGENPAQPGQPCPSCGGNRMTNCRMCQARGFLICPQCHGRRGTPCPGCQGTGQISEEIGISCGAKTHFKLKAQGLPSGLRRGLDRLGIINLAKGHADIAMLEPVTPADEHGQPLHDSKTPPSPSIEYHATMPYADVKARFGKNRIMIFGVFGKRAVILDLPPFLDEALQPWREKLQQATLGKVSIEHALEARAMRDVLHLELGGKGTLEELRKLYPSGLSRDTAAEMLKNTRLALNFITLQLRVCVAVICGLLSGGLFGAWFMTDTHIQFTQGLTIPFAALCDFALPLVAMAISWGALSTSIRIVLQRRFPHFRIPLQKKIGKTGYTMLSGIMLFYMVFLIIAPVKPAWLAALLASHV